MTGKVLIAAPVHTVLTEGLTAAGYELKIAVDISQQTAAGLIADCVGVVTSTRLQLDRQLLDAAPYLKWIGRMGSGMEVIDVPYAESRNILCVSSPEGNCNSVAEHAMGLLLGLTKKIVSSSAEVRDGKWIRDANRGMELEGRTIGIIGFGHTGSAFARKLSGFDVRILAFDKHRQGVTYPGVEFTNSIEKIYEQAEVVSFHVPLQEDTVNYLDKSFVDSMLHPFILINTSRGRVVNTAALADGLLSQKIVAAGLDVLETEPPSKMDGALKHLTDKLLSLPQVIITPHIAGYSNEALFKMSRAILNKIVTLS